MCYTTIVGTSQPTHHPPPIATAGAATSRADTRNRQSGGASKASKQLSAVRERNRYEPGAPTDSKQTRPTQEGGSRPPYTERTKSKGRNHRERGPPEGPETVNQSFSLTDRPPPCGAYNLGPQGTTQTRRPGESPEATAAAAVRGTDRIGDSTRSDAEG